MESMKVNLENLLYFLLETPEIGGKKLLLLVHPDAVFEISDNQFIIDYIDRLAKHLDHFDYIITHRMFSDAAPKTLASIQDRIELWNRMMHLLNQKSNWIGLDRKFSASFKEALPDYLIDNEGTEIWFGGGYKDLCVKDTQMALQLQLGDIIEETGGKIAGCYAPLIVVERHRPRFLEEALSPINIEGLSNYFQNRTWPSKEDALASVLNLLRSDLDYRRTNEEDLTNFIEQQVPFYQTTKGWKVGFPVKKTRKQKKKFDWTDVTIKRNSLEQLTTAGYVNPFDGPELSPVKLVPVNSLHPTESGQDQNYIEATVSKLLSGDKDDFKAIIHDINGSIIDGHHRWLIAKKLGMKTIPAQMVTFTDDR